MLKTVDDIFGLDNDYNLGKWKKVAEIYQNFGILNFLKNSEMFFKFLVHFGKSCFGRFLD